jgi:hypothetical protein
VTGPTLSRTARTSVRLLPALAAAGTGAAGFLYLAGKIDALKTLQLEKTHERQMFLIGVIEQMTRGPETEPERKQAPSGLRAVS